MGGILDSSCTEVGAGKEMGGKKPKQTPNNNNNNKKKYKKKINKLTLPRKMKTVTYLPTTVFCALIAEVGRPLMERKANLFLCISHIPGLLIAGK